MAHVEAVAECEGDLGEKHVTRNEGYQIKVNKVWSSQQAERL